MYLFDSLKIEITFVCPFIRYFKDMKRKVRTDRYVVIATMGETFKIKKSLMEHIQREHTKEQEALRKTKTCYSGAYANEMDFVRIGWDKPF